MPSPFNLSLPIALKQEDLILGLGCQVKLPAEAVRSPAPTICGLLLHGQEMTNIPSAVGLVLLTDTAVHIMQNKKLVPPLGW